MSSGEDLPQSLVLWESLSLLHFWRTVLPGITFFLGSFYLSILWIHYHTLLDCKISPEKSTDGLMGAFFYMMSYFSLDPFEILCLWLDSLMFLSVIFFGFSYLKSFKHNEYGRSFSSPEESEVWEVWSYHFFFFKLAFCLSLSLLPPGFPFSYTDLSDGAS